MSNKKELEELEKRHKELNNMFIGKHKELTKFMESEIKNRSNVNINLKKVTSEEYRKIIGITMDFQKKELQELTEQIKKKEELAKLNSININLSIEQKKKELEELEKLDKIKKEDADKILKDFIKDKKKEEEVIKKHVQVERQRVVAQNDSMNAFRKNSIEMSKSLKENSKAFSELKNASKASIINRMGDSVTDVLFDQNAKSLVRGFSPMLSKLNGLEKMMGKHGIFSGIASLGSLGWNAGKKVSKWAKKDGDESSAENNSNSGSDSGSDGGSGEDSNSNNDRWAKSRRDDEEAEYNPGNDENEKESECENTNDGDYKGCECKIIERHHEKILDNIKFVNKSTARKNKTDLFYQKFRLKNDKTIIKLLKEQSGGDSSGFLGGINEKITNLGTSFLGGAAGGALLTAGTFLLKRAIPIAGIVAGLHSIGKSANEILNTAKSQLELDKSREKISNNAMDNIPAKLKILEERVNLVSDPAEKSRIQIEILKLKTEFVKLKKEKKDIQKEESGVVNVPTEFFSWKNFASAFAFTNNPMGNPTTAGQRFGNRMNLNSRSDRYKDDTMILQNKTLKTLADVNNNYKGDVREYRKSKYFKEDNFTSLKGYAEKNNLNIKTKYNKDMQINEGVLKDKRSREALKEQSKYGFLVTQTAGGSHANSALGIAHKHGTKEDLRTDGVSDEKIIAYAKGMREDSKNIRAAYEFDLSKNDQFETAKKMAKEGLLVQPHAVDGKKLTKTEKAQVDLLNKLLAKYNSGDKHHKNSATKTIRTGTVGKGFSAEHFDVNFGKDFAGNKRQSFITKLDANEMENQKKGIARRTGKLQNASYDDNVSSDGYSSVSSPDQSTEKQYSTPVKKVSVKKVPKKVPVTPTPTEIQKQTKDNTIIKDEVIQSQQQTTPLPVQSTPQESPSDEGGMSTLASKMDDQIKVLKDLSDAIKYGKGNFMTIGV